MDPAMFSIITLDELMDNDVEAELIVSEHIDAEFDLRLDAIQSAFEHILD